MSETQQVVVVASKSFSCHGEPHPGRPCTAKLTQAEAWVLEASKIAEVTGRWPSVKDLADHIYCGRCSALGRKAGLRFHHYQKTVVWMEQKRIERVNRARQAFKRYFPKESPRPVSVDATSTSPNPA